MVNSLFICFSLMTCSNVWETKTQPCWIDTENYCLNMSKINSYEPKRLMKTVDDFHHVGRIFIGCTYTTEVGKEYVSLDRCK